jgi:hypothetical protein
MARSIEQKIDDLLDALECGTEGVKLVAQALSDRNRQVRQSAFLLLSDLNETIAKEALWNYLPFAEMQCLHTTTKFNSRYCDPGESSPDYFAIANYNNTLVCYWDVTYRSSFINIWDLETGERKYDFDLPAHEFGIGKRLSLTCGDKFMLSNKGRTPCAPTVKDSSER